MTATVTGFFVCIHLITGIMKCYNVGVRKCAKLFQVLYYSTSISTWFKAGIAEVIEYFN